MADLQAGCMGHSDVFIPPTGGHLLVPHQQDAVPGGHSQAMQEDIQYDG